MREILRWFGLLSGWPLQWLFFKRKTYYENREKQGRIVKGGALIISNHYSVWDYVQNVFLFPFRKLYVVMSEEIFKKGKFFEWSKKIYGGIKSDRDVHGMRFIDESVALLERGKLVQIYPEAYITTDGEMHDFKSSYIIIALRANVPIIPVMIDGNYGVFKRSHLIIGEPIDLNDYCTSLNPSREEIMALNKMVEEKARALKADLDMRIERDKNKRKRKKENSK